MRRRQGILFGLGVSWRARSRCYCQRADPRCCVLIVARCQERSDGAFNNGNENEDSHEDGLGPFESVELRLVP